MNERITESDLILPALYVIDQRGAASTSDLIAILTDVFVPKGEDAQILTGRKDTKFSQLVRNLTSHRKHNGMAKYASYQNRVYRLTEIGLRKLNVNRAAMEYLFRSHLSADAVLETIAKTENAEKIGRMLEFFDENEPVSEGKLTLSQTSHRKRSAALRKYALEHYTGQMGHISCAVCGFDFAKQYGEYGRGYIELHHIKPVCKYANEDLKKVLSEAVKNIVPLCANCHRMIHRNREQILTPPQLRAIIKGQGTAGDGKGR